MIKLLLIAGCILSMAVDSIAQKTEQIVSIQAETTVAKVPARKGVKDAWMQENLHLTRFKNGDSIPQAQDEEDWDKCGKDKKPCWCYYERPAHKKDTAVLTKEILYNYYALTDARGLAPKGWHIPTLQEWKKISVKVSTPAPEYKNLFGGAADSSFEYNEEELATKQEGLRSNTGIGYIFSDPIYSFSKYSHLWTLTATDAEKAVEIIIWAGGFSYRSVDMNNGFCVRCVRDAKK